MCKTNTNFANIFGKSLMTGTFCWTNVFRKFEDADCTITQDDRSILKQHYNAARFKEPATQTLCSLTWIFSFLNIYLCIFLGCASFASIFIVLKRNEIFQLSLIVIKITLIVHSCELTIPTFLWHTFCIWRSHQTGSDPFCLWVFP